MHAQKGVSDNNDLDYSIYVPKLSEHKIGDIIREQLQVDQLVVLLNKH